MKTKTLGANCPFIWITAVALMACTLSGNVPQTGQATPTTASATMAQASPVPTIPLPGPALSHFAPGQKIFITYIQMSNSNLGWGIGGQAKVGDHVFRTQDGGQTWRDITPPEPAPASGAQIQATGFFRDSLTGWVVYAPGEGAPAPDSVRIWNTHDGGASWQYSSLDTSGFQEYFSPSSLTFVDDRHGWILAHLGAGRMNDYIAIVSTMDGGLTWKVVIDTTAGAGGLESCEKNALAFVDAQTGWLTLDCRGVDPVPHVYKTIDGGATWRRLDLAAPAGAPDLFRDNACGLYSPVPLSALSSIFWMKCLDNATAATEQDFLYRTEDGGQSWQTAPYPGGNLMFFGQQQGFALANSISVTSDGGKTWTKRSFVTWDGQFSFVDPNLAWVVATNQGALALVKTTDGCKSWVIISPLVAP